MKETKPCMTFAEIKQRLDKVQKTIESLQCQDKKQIINPQIKEKQTQLIQIRESLQNKLNLLTEMDKGVIHTDDENKAKELAKQGVQVQLHKKGEPLDTHKIKEAIPGGGIQFDLEQTKLISKEVAKAFAMALKEDGAEISGGKITHLEERSFDLYFTYKNGTDDEFSIHLDGTKIIYSDFTFSEEIGEVGIQGASEPIVNKDVVKTNVLKVWAKQGTAKSPEAEVTENEEGGDLMQQLEKALKSHDWYYMMSDDNRWYEAGIRQANNIRDLIVKLKDAGQGDEAEALYKSYADKNKLEEGLTNEYKVGDKVSKKFASTDDDYTNEYEIVSIENGRATVKDLKTGKITGMALTDLVKEASVGSIQKKHGEIVAKMKALAVKYKGGDQSVVPELKALTAEKKKLEAELDAAVSGTGTDQELDSSVNEYEHHYRVVGGQCRKYNDEGDYTVVSMSYCRYNEGKEKAKKDYDKDGKIETPSAEYKGVKDKAIKKATVKEGEDEVAKLQKIADDTSKTPKERDEARNKMYALKKKKKDMLKEDWGSSDQGAMNRSIHKDLGEPENMPMPFDDKFESAVEDAVDFYWNEWEEYQTDREGLIDHAKRAYYRAYFPEKFAGFQKMFSEEIETIQDPKTKEFTKREKISDKDKETVKKIQAMMAKEKAPTKEGLEGHYQITVAVRDAAKAHDIIRDMFANDVEFSGSDVFNLKSKEMAHELYDTLIDAGIEVTDNNLQETPLHEEGAPTNPDDAPAVDITGKKYSVGDILDFKGQLFQAQIGAGGRVILQHLDQDKKPTSKVISAEDPKFAAVLKSSKIVDTKYGDLDEANLNPELLKKVSRFVKGLATYYGYSEESALYNINDALSQLYPGIRESKVNEEDHEVSMAEGQLDDIIKNANELKSKLGSEEKDIPGWIQDHISQSQNFINQANTSYHELETQPEPSKMAL